MKDTDKVTMTVGQLKKLIKESINENEVYVTWDDVIDEIESRLIDHEKYKDLYTKNTRSKEYLLRQLRDEKLGWFSEQIISRVSNYTNDYPIVANYYKISSAVIEIISKLLRGSTIEELKNQYGDKPIDDL